MNHDKALTWKIPLNFTKMATKWTSTLLLLQLTCCFSFGSCGKVLVWPTEYSHWINMKIILDELTLRGHEVTVLTSSASILVNPNEKSTIKFEVYPTATTKDNFENIFMQIINKWIYDVPRDTLFEYFSQMQEMISHYLDHLQKLCTEVVYNRKLRTKLMDSRFDVVLADPVSPCGELLAEFLNVSLVYSLRFSHGYTWEKYTAAVPFPPSYVPIIMSELTDKMTFMERVKNMIYVLYFDFWFKSFDKKKWDQFYSEVLGRPTTLFETMRKADIWLIRTYWDLEFPRPLLPNYDLVGGLHCKPAKALPKEMEDFVQSSGENGVVVFSLGSMVNNITEDRANAIASALAQIPQKVIWRFNGKKPATLGTNTQLYKWIPQNDLLDQPQNIVHLKAKGAAVRVDFNTMSSTDLLNAMKTVINDPSYKENAMKLSRIQHDQPVKPLDRAVFWIEFVMRHKGAKHLRPAAHDLTWFQYHSLDVIGFLLACVASVIVIISKFCLFCWQKFAKTPNKKKKE
ncbi:UDP-glucuronosyltransferase 2B31 isoform X2 [Tupaia chinensis]|uniref:UDP-glucuronosyltransferase 2B31 isoform X2 n=1 Tax=Tupaia chinensis TaxID=246437 RepID=UPI000FFC1927|nr:UDP-glucuronosyltransferase 2B31 isoform X2 [Tupaia chinensis]